MQSNYVCGYQTPGVALDPRLVVPLGHTHSTELHFCYVTMHTINAARMLLCHTAFRTCYGPHVSPNAIAACDRTCTTTPDPYPAQAQWKPPGSKKTTSCGMLHAAYKHIAPLNISLSHQGL